MNVLVPMRRALQLLHDNHIEPSTLRMSSRAYALLLLDIKKLRSLDKRLSTDARLALVFGMSVDVDTSREDVHFEFVVFGE